MQANCGRAQDWIHFPQPIFDGNILHNDRHHAGQIQISGIRNILCRQRLSLSLSWICVELRRVLWIACRMIHNKAPLMVKSPWLEETRSISTSDLVWNLAEDAKWYCSPHCPPTTKATWTTPPGTSHETRHNHQKIAKTRQTPSCTTQKKRMLEPQTARNSTKSSFRVSINIKTRISIQTRISI